MINKTRIFISSAYESDLKEPRKIIKEHLEKSGYEVPIFEHGDFGTWEKDTLVQCLDVVKNSDVYILLINKKSGANSTLMRGNVTPTYLEYRAAVIENKHILVFVTPEIKEGFESLKGQLYKLNKEYYDKNHRNPDSPYDAFKDWFDSEISEDGIAAQFLKKADSFIWAFLFELYNNGHWLYNYDISRSLEQAQNISAMLSTSFRSVVGLIPERKKIEELKNITTYLIDYADYTLIMLTEKNNIVSNLESPDYFQHHKEDLWSDFLSEGIKFLNHPIEIIQAPEFNPIIVNTINGCFAASLYRYNNKEEKLMLVGTTGGITAPSIFTLEEQDIFVVNSYVEEKRIIMYIEEKHTMYFAEPVDDFVICLHFALKDNMTKEEFIAYNREIESAIIDNHEYYFGFLKLLIGG